MYPHSARKTRPLVRPRGLETLLAKVNIHIQMTAVITANAHSAFGGIVKIIYRINIPAKRG